MTAPLRKRGLPRASRRAWVRDGDGYRTFTAADRALLVANAPSQSR